MFRDRAHRLHFVGIGGIGMSGIAEVLLNLGFDVRGSDLTESPVTDRLVELGATVYRGHLAQHVGDAEVLVTSSAIKGGNPEVDEARERNIPVIPRAEMLAELMRLKYGIAVAGTHGKTTTTSLIATILASGGVDPTVVIGGRLKSIRSNARLGEGEYLVAEADESDGSFLKLMPTIGVVTNIDLEHMDHWSGGLPQIVDAYVDFINKVPFYGSAVLCLDHPTVQGILPRIEKRYVTYGLSAQADYCAENVTVENGSAAFSLRCFGKPAGRIHLNMIGKHNVLNALAAIAVSDEVGVTFPTMAKALRDFEGIARRFENKGSVDDVVVVDDYGHHPAEIVATLTAAREAYERRLVVVFQPHRYSRTRDLMSDFATSFNGCHKLLVTDIYAAGEQAIAGIDAQSIVDAVRQYGHQDAEVGGSIESVAKRLMEVVRPGDLLLTLGAGDVWKVGERWLENKGRVTKGKTS